MESWRKMSSAVLVVMMFIGFSNAFPYQLFHQDLVVGGDAGWRVGYDYKSWGNEVPVRVGDILEFRYTIGEHTLTLLKSREAFDKCDMSDPVEEYEDGDTRIELTKPGWMYFVDAYGDHCDIGVKMAIKVAP
ncbi:hypothetical protein MPTK1_5g00140 [Marchantia polymorpha subsp. ruderalis]|uniref:Phytocyanin domain-containing protein n=2 Tax=Marchantia polymorpha TaxID=3197 RepID=A0AAF6BDC1_MARPO|nr:hypothetical protein MARPO_0078s0015 [Marchantia polymorpha]BBN10005.1 hypothetical protein Mp_5g00140 [Marchantia polymorpha subsp. ruderalis]|eukprot:PTQ34599.1 hypothetical protein MARPO_0078s0015 [Marchantia polymorpha]